jgi:hypothetical protein
MRAALPAVLLAVAAAAQQPQQSEGSISGRVTVGPDRRPVRGAAVVVEQQRGESGLVWSGENGYYRVGGLPPGRYLVNAHKPGLGSYGRPVEVRAGEETRGIDIPFAARSAIAGRVRDAEDLPVEGATVSLRTTPWQRGRQSFPTYDAATTDDRGEYRASVRPGADHILALCPPFLPGVAGRYWLAHPPLFHRNALEPAQAQPVRADAGVKLETVDFEVPPPAPTVLRIQTLAAELGEQPRSCVRCAFAVFAPHAGGWVQVTQRGQSDRQGRIEIHGLYPGAYRIGAVGRSADLVYWGYEDVAVEEGSPRGYELTAWAPGPVRARVTLMDPPESLRGEETAWTASLRATVLDHVYPVRPRGGPYVLQGAGAAGHGELFLPPGESELRLFVRPPLPQSAYIEEVRIAGRPQPGPYATVSREGRAPAIEVRIGFATAKLSGKVSGFDPNEFPRPLVRAIAQPPDGYGRDTPLIVEDGGAIRETELQPGTYLLFAVSGLARDLDFADPGVQARYANYGKRVTLAPGESVRVELEAIP